MSSGVAIRFVCLLSEQITVKCRFGGTRSPGDVT